MSMGLQDVFSFSLRISQPSSGASFIAPASITLAVEAASSQGAVTQVVCKAGDSTLWTDTQPPFSNLWLDVPTGSYTLTATAWDTTGNSTTSQPVTVHVTPPQTLSGTLDYAGAATGVVRVSAGGIVTTATTPGPFEISPLAGLTFYTVFAFVDTNGDGQRQASEPFGSRRVYLDGDLNGVAITIRDRHAMNWLLLLGGN
jgi:hypothetical protein